MSVTCTLPHGSVGSGYKAVTIPLWERSQPKLGVQPLHRALPIAPSAGADVGSCSSWRWGHTMICGASAMSYFIRAATSRGPEIPVLIKSCIFYYAAQLVHADYCSFTSPGLSPLSLKYVMCQSDRARGGFSTHKPKLDSIRIMHRKEMEKDRGTVGAVEGSSGWKQRERGDLGGK